MRFKFLLTNRLSKSWKAQTATTAVILVLLGGGVFAWKHQTSAQLDRRLMGTSQVQAQATEKAQSPAPSANPQPSFSPTISPIIKPKIAGAQQPTASPNVEIGYKTNIIFMSSLGTTTRPTCTNIGFNATLHSTGSASMSYYWRSNDGSNAPIQNLTFNGAETKTISYDMPFIPAPPILSQYYPPKYQAVAGTVYLIEISPNVQTYALSYNWGTPVLDC